MWLCSKDHIATLGIVMCLALFSAAPARTEIYRDIGPLDTLGEIRARFPSATIEQLHPAWATEDDLMYEITGQGLSGSIILKFNDPRAIARALITMHQARPERVAKLTAIADTLTEEDAVVSWVRWVPNEPIPLARYVAKYGKPVKSGFRDEDMEPYREWPSRGVEVFLTDDERFVSRVDFTFTLSEQRAAWQTRRGRIPDHLKPTPTAKPVAKPAPGKPTTGRSLKP